jgi:uncharacterized protein
MPAIHAPPAFHLLVKPTGAICNLNCEYCFYLSKEGLYPGSHFRMSHGLLETYIRQLIEAHRAPEVTIAWQGGEPMLMGLDFFRRSITLQQKYSKPHMIVHNTIQTNGVLLDDEWCDFFQEHDYLVGLSIDGPQARHNVYRTDKRGLPAFDRVMRALDCLKKHKVKYNILATVHAANVNDPLKVYRFLRDHTGSPFFQFIPIVERDNETGFQEGDRVSERSVTPEQYGKFLITIFDEWVRRDVGRVYVQIFDVALENWVGVPTTLCVFSPACGDALTMEHNGDLYPCDHFVEPEHLLGNINDTPLIDLVASSRQRKFGQDKIDTLPRYCRTCEVRFACHGGCPKNRFIETPDGEPGLNYLCAGYKAFFKHIDQPMRIMANLLLQGRAPAEIMQILEAQRVQPGSMYAGIKRNAPCPCGSGKKFKRCHGRDTH